MKLTDAGRLALTAGLLVPLVGSTAGAEILPDVSVHLKAAHYTPAEKDLHWTTWIGAGASLLRVSGTTAYFTADLETLAGNTRRGFDATQANYHLEAGIRQAFGGWQGAVALHHVSRHLIDDTKTRAVDWNMACVRAAGRLHVGGVPLILRVGAGHTLQQSAGYHFEAAAQADAELVRRPWGRLYARGDLRAVTVERGGTLDRGGFLDADLEGGVRFRRGARALELYGAYDRRNDVLLLAGRAHKRALFGFRISFKGNESEAEEGPPSPVLWP